HKSLKGHSVFRPHVASRPIYFGDPVRSTLSIIETGNKLVYCHVRRMSCYRYTLGKKSLFEMQFTRPEEISTQSLRAFWRLHKERWARPPKKRMEKPRRNKR